MVVGRWSLVVGFVAIAIGINLTRVSIDVTTSNTNVRLSQSKSVSTGAQPDKGFDRRNYIKHNCQTEPVEVGFDKLNPTTFSIEAFDNRAIVRLSQSKSGWTDQGFDKLNLTGR